MRVETFRPEYKNPLVNQYLYDFSSVEELYAYNPYTVQGFQERLKKVLQEYNTDREQLVRILLPYNRELGCGPETEENIRMLGRKDAVVVVTGQQAGVFTGPLYTIYKTISVIQLARQKSRELGVPVIPVFWVASEDHDFNEINHLDLINSQGRMERLVLEEEPQGKYSVGDIPVTEAVFKMIERLAEETNPAEWKDGYIEQLKTYARQADNLADWFARIMMGFFGQYGLVIINPMLPGIRQILAPLYGQFIMAAEEVNGALHKGQQKVIAMGFEPQVDKAPEHLHLFRYIDGERLPILKEESGYSVRGHDLVWTGEELVAAARENPEQFSPNVVLRPVAQDFIMPLLAYVAGPGEISYYALYKEIYPLFNMSMPVIYPRANVTLMEGNIGKLMKKYRLNMSDVTAGLEDKLRDLLKEIAEVDIEGLFGDLKNKVSDIFGQVTGEAEKIDPALTIVGEESLNKVLYQINHYMEKTQQMHRKKNEVVIRQFEKIAVSLFPRNNYQERVFNIFPYLFKHGPGLLEGLVALPLLQGKEHNIVWVNP